MRQTFQSSLRATLLATGLGCALMLSPAVQAADSASAQYQQDVERCNTTPGIDKAACLREAGAALQAARSNGLESPGERETRNRTDRCDGLPADQREDCLILMDDANARVEGSVDGGGILRETTITIPAPSGS